MYSNDRTHRMKNMSSEISTTEFFVRNLEYIETPQYLRKSLFPKSDALRFSGLVNPLEADHHLKITEWCKYREGVIIRRPVREQRGSWANIGLLKDCQVNMMLEENTRITVKLNETGFNNELKCKTLTLKLYILPIRLFRLSGQLCRAHRQTRPLLGLHSPRGQ